MEHSPRGGQEETDHFTTTSPPGDGAEMWRRLTAAIEEVRDGLSPEIDSSTLAARITRAMSSLDDAPTKVDLIRRLSEREREVVALRRRLDRIEYAVLMIRLTLAAGHDSVYVLRGDVSSEVDDINAIFAEDLLPSRGEPSPSGLEEH